MNNYVKRDNFYIFLPSNSSMDVFPKNRQSQYSTQLASPIELEGRWEVGLAEIHIPTDWMNITSLNNSFTLRYSKSMPVMIKHSTVKYDPGMFKFDMKFYKNYATQFQYLRLMEGIIREHSSYALSTVNWDDALNLSYKTLGGKVFGFLKLKEGFSLYIEATKENDEVLRKRIFNTPSIAVNTFTPGPFLIEIGEIDNDNMLTISQHNIFVASNVNKAVVSETEQLETRDIEHFTNITIPTGCYKSRLDLINALNQAVNPFCDEKLLFSLTENNRLKIWSVNGIRFNIKFKNEDVYFAKMLGLNWKIYQNSFILPTGASIADHICKYPIDLKNNVYGMYIYSDIITQQFVGDKFANLLRIVPVTSGSEELNINVFSSPHYFDLSRNYINNIYIEIKSGAGNFLIFEGGSVLCKLHFRQKV